MYQPKAFVATQDFDPHVYFNIVADHLLKNYGERALFYADQALAKMRALGDNEGFDLWLAVHEHLTQKAADAMEDIPLQHAAAVSGAIH